MSIVTFALEIYFAAMLGIAGFAKIYDPKHFAATLHQQKVVPEHSIGIFSRFISWTEVIVAFFIISGIAAIGAAFIIVALFSGFLGFKIFLLATGRTKDCGCYGSAKPEKVDGVSIVVSLILVLLAVLHLVLVIHASSVALQWRLVAVVIFVAVCGFLLASFFTRRLQAPVSFPATLNTEESEIGKPAPLFSALDQYHNTVQLDNFQGQQCLLAFVAPGCPACPGALTALKEVLQNVRDLVVLVIGGDDLERNQAYASEQEVTVPFLTPAPDMVEKLYHIQSFPIMLIIDERGVIRAKDVVNNSGHLRELLKKGSVLSSAEIGN